MFVIDTNAIRGEVIPELDSCEDEIDTLEDTKLSTPPDFGDDGELTVLEKGIKNVKSNISSARSALNNKADKVEEMEEKAKKLFDGTNIEYTEGMQFESTEEIKAYISFVKMVQENPDFYANINGINPWSSTGNTYTVNSHGQCVWFAWAKFYEIYGFSPWETGSGNGRDCASNLIKNHSDIFEQGLNPKVGSVFSLTKTR